MRIFQNPLEIQPNHRIYSLEYNHGKADWRINRRSHSHTLNRFSLSISLNNTSFLACRYNRRVRVWNSSRRYRCKYVCQVLLVLSSHHFPGPLKYWGTSYWSSRRENRNLQEGFRLLDTGGKSPHTWYAGMGSPKRLLLANKQC